MEYFRNHEEYLRPYWQTTKIVDESIMPVRFKQEEGKNLPDIDFDTAEGFSIQLMHDIGRVISVRTATHDVTFEEGIDYKVIDGRLVIPDGSRIKVMRQDEYIIDRDNGFACTEGGWLAFGESNCFHKLQYSVSYEPASNCFDGKYRPEVSTQLALSRQRLDSGKLKLAFYGDSITYGCNASGLASGLPPYMPIYPLLAAEALRGRGYKVDYYNPSIGGMSSIWGRDQAAYYFDDFKPDLVMIAFGMNDGSGRLPVDQFIGNTRSMIRTIRASNPDAEFVLCATTLPNRLAKGFYGLQEEYEQPLHELADTEDCAFLDMTELHRILLSRKAYHHMTGNNINHPSDFLARLYAQGLLALLGAEGSR